MEASLGLSLLGTGLSFFSQRSAAKNQRRAGEIAGENAAREASAAMQRNAAEAVNRLKEARDIENAADDNIRLIQQNAQLSRSNVRASAARSGITVDVGSITAINDRITSLAERDQLVILYSTMEQVENKRSRSRQFLRAGERQYENKTNQGIFARWNANQQAAQTKMNSIATLINGVANAFGTYTETKHATKFPTGTSITPEARTRLGHVY